MEIQLQFNLLQAFVLALILKKEKQIAQKR